MKTSFLPLLLLAFALSAGAQPRMFKIMSGSDRNLVEFRSDAATETVTGRTRTITGFVELDPASESTPPRAEIHVDLASLKTGIDLRDRHMRENHLQTDRYPEAVFTLTSLTLPESHLQPGKRTPVRAQGRLQLHGVERNVEPTTYLTYSESGGVPALRIEAEFTVNLSDYSIARPQFLLLRLAETQKISVDISAE